MPPKRKRQPDDDDENAIKLRIAADNYRFPAPIPKSVEKKIIVVNNTWNTTGVQSMSLFLTMFPCQAKAFIWDLTISGNKGEVQPLKVAWFLYRKEDGTNDGTFSITNATSFYSPERNLITGGTTTLKPGTYTERTFQDISDPTTKWVTTYNLEAEDPIRACTHDGVGNIVGTLSGAFDWVGAASIGAGTIPIVGDATIQETAALITTREEFAHARFKGSSGTFRKLELGDELKLAWVQESATTSNTSIYGTVQFFLLS